MNEFIHSIIEMNKENYLGQVEEYLTGNKHTNEDAITWLFNIPKRSRSSEHIEFLLKKYNQDKPKDKQVHTMDDLNRALMQEEINNFKTGNLVEESGKYNSRVSGCELISDSSSQEEMYAIFLDMQNN